MPDPLKPVCPKCNRGMIRRDDATGSYLRCEDWKACPGRRELAVEPIGDQQAAVIATSPRLLLVAAALQGLLSNPRIFDENFSLNDITQGAMNQADAALKKMRE